jgi:hypothetical protein
MPTCRPVWPLLLVVVVASCTAAAPKSPEPPFKRPETQKKAEPEAACREPVDLPRPDPDRPRYRLRIVLRPEHGLVQGRLRVAFTPDLATDELVFRLWPNGPRQSRAGTRLEVGRVESDGRPLDTRLSGPTTLEVDPGPRLQPGDTIEVTLPWRLELPGPSFDRISADGTSLRLGSFFPLLAWQPGAGWLRDPPSMSLAETSTSPVADFDVALRLPPGIEALASGREVSPGRWRAQAVRDFALATGRFDTATATARAPQPVRVTVGVDGAVGESPEPYRNAVVRALEALAKRYGPYPWPSFNLAITPWLAHAGIEYPGLVMQGEGTLGVVTNHEVAHQWFYSLVGSNPAREPWLDEGLTTYAQSRIDSQLGLFAFEPVPRAARNRLGAGMPYWDGHQDAYFQGVYAQGVKALAAVGPPRDVDCGLRRYVGANAYSIADSSDLIRALEAEVEGAGRTLERFGVRP